MERKEKIVNDKQPNFFQRAVENTIEFLSPKRALDRARNKAAAALIRKYEAAGRGRRTDGWSTKSTDVTQETLTDLRLLRDRARDLARNDSYAKRSVLEIVPNNTIGSGIFPAPTGTKAYAKKIMDLWKLWAGSTDCDHGEQMNFYAMQHLVMKTVAQSGEAIVVMRSTRDVNLPLQLQLQVLEGDYIDHTRHNQIVNGDNRIIQGIEYNKAGKRVAYWLHTEHPGSGHFTTSVRVPARNVIHVYEILRPGQVRGIPFGVSSMLRLRDLNVFEDAELVRQQVAATFAGFITNNATVNTDLQNVDNTDANGNEIERMEPGELRRLRPGEDITFGNPPTKEGYSEYTRDLKRGVAAGYGPTYESMTGDLTGVNFSSGRMGWIEFQRLVNTWQEFMIVPMLCERVWKWFLQQAILEGKLNKIVPADWTAPAREMLDPYKETMAQEMQVQNGFRSWSKTVRSNGYDPDAVIEEMKRDKERFAAAGITVASDLSKFPPKGRVPYPEDQSDAGQK